MEERGKYVSRSVYQKVVEENRKLLKDIRALVDNSLTIESINVRRKWCDKFQKDREFVNLISESLGMKVKTEDGFDVYQHEEAYFASLGGDPLNHLPEKGIVRDIINNKEKCFKLLESCQEYCDQINSIDL